MGIYSAARYGLDSYGQFSKLDYYAQPFISKAVDYTKVELTWVEPSGEGISELRVLRSNDGYPETPEDGKLIYYWDNFSTEPQRTEFLDGEEVLNPVPSGRFVYYRIWIRVIGGVWKIAGDTYTLVPARHGPLSPDQTILVDTKNKLLDILPRIYTTALQSPIDEVDPNSDLSRFLDAFAFELDTTLTYADLLLPTESWKYVSPEILTLQSVQFGIDVEPYVATNQQRKLVRNAISIYQNKGTLKGIEAFVESYTGFPPTVTSSPNLVLSTQDSTFTNGVGFWKSVGNAIITTETTVPGVSETLEPYIENNGYVAKIIVNEIGSKVTNGAEKPVTQGTPVEPGTAYSFSGYGKSASGNMGVKGYVSWYGLNGELVDVDPPRSFIQTPQSVGAASWSKFQVPARSPGVTENITSYSIVDNLLTFYLDTANVMFRGETILVSGISEAIDGTYQIEANQIIPGRENELIVITAQPNIGLTSCEGTLQEANPNFEVVTSPPSPSRVIISGEIVNGIATVTFADNHGLLVGDKVLIQAMSTSFCFGIHTVIDKDNTSITFQIYQPYTPIPNEDLDESFPITGSPYGIAVKILPGNSGVVPKAYYASFELEFTTTGTLYLDLLQLAKFTVPEYHQPRAVEIFLNPNKTNLVLNPGLNPTTLSTTWALTGTEPAVTAVRTGATEGALIGKLPDGSPALAGAGYVLLVEKVGNGDFSVQTTSAPLTTGKFVTISFYAKTFTNTNNVNKTLAFKVETINTSTVPATVLSTNPVVVSEELTTTEPTIVATKSWQRFYRTIFVPGTSSTTTSIRLSILGSDSAKFWIDRVQIEESFRATDYFAGSDAPGEASIESAFWQTRTAPYNSPSHQYVNFDQKIDRLIEQLPKYLPANLSFLVRWHGGGVAKPTN
jgi:hypothetical protein